MLNLDSSIPILIIPAIVALLFLFLVSLVYLRKAPRTRAQKWRRAFAAKMHKDLLNSRPDLPALIGRTRAMDALAFEELVLISLKHGGFKIKNTTGYSGDGGIDGQVQIDGAWYLLQMKRYQKTINPQHVLDLSEVARKRGQSGIFIHTGRTGPKSYAALRKVDNVSLLSGPTLQRLLTGEAKDAIAASLQYLHQSVE